MPGFPNQASPFFVAHLYTRVDPDFKQEDTKEHVENPVCYIAEEGYRPEGKLRIVSVNKAGLDEICCCVNVKKFLQVKKTCEWIRVMHYVDDVSIAEADSGCTYIPADIERMDYEILSTPFQLSKPEGTIQVFVQTHGPGKNWPKCTFKFSYYDSRDTLAKLIPSRTASMNSFKFRDVDKKLKTWMDQLTELQYATEERALREKIEAEAEAERKANDITERVKSSNKETVKIIERRSITPEVEVRHSQQMASSSSSSAIKRQRFADDCNDDYESITSHRRAKESGSSSTRTNRPRPAPLMMKSSMIPRAPIPDRRW